MPRQAYSENVFINCPFDPAYKRIFDAIVFAIHDCGFIARCALEEDDGSQIRVQRIVGIIEESRFAIHDLSRVELDRGTKLPRFNMPLELGVFLGAKYFGNSGQKRKACLILDSEKYRYQQFISDIAGQDLKSHENDPEKAIRIVRNWLRSFSRTSIPGGTVISKRYCEFMSELPELCNELKLDLDDLVYNDYVLLVSKWLSVNA